MWYDSDNEIHLCKRRREGAKNKTYHIIIDPTSYHQQQQQYTSESRAAPKKRSYYQQEAYWNDDDNTLKNDRGDVVLDPVSFKANLNNYLASIKSNGNVDDRRMFCRQYMILLEYINYLKQIDLQLTTTKDITREQKDLILTNVYSFEDFIAFKRSYKLYKDLSFDNGKHSAPIAMHILIHVTMGLDAISSTTDNKKIIILEKRDVDFLYENLYDPVLVAMEIDVNILDGSIVNLPTKNGFYIKFDGGKSPLHIYNNKLVVNEMDIIVPTETPDVPSIEGEPYRRINNNNNTRKIIIYRQSEQHTLYKKVERILSNTSTNTTTTDTIEPTIDEDEDDRSTIDELSGGIINTTTTTIDKQQQPPPPPRQKSTRKQQATTSGGGDNNTTNIKRGSMDNKNYLIENITSSFKGTSTESPLKASRLTKLAMFELEKELGSKKALYLTFQATIDIKNNTSVPWNITNIRKRFNGTLTNITLELTYGHFYITHLVVAFLKFCYMTTVEKQTQHQILFTPDLLELLFKEIGKDNSYSIASNSVKKELINVFGGQLFDQKFKGISEIVSTALLEWLGYDAFVLSNEIENTYVPTVRTCDYDNTILGIKIDTEQDLINVKILYTTLEALLKNNGKTYYDKNINVPLTDDQYITSLAQLKADELIEIGKVFQNKILINNLNKDTTNFNPPQEVLTVDPNNPESNPLNIITVVAVEPPSSDIPPPPPAPPPPDPSTFKPLVGGINLTDALKASVDEKKITSSTTTTNTNTTDVQKKKGVQIAHIKLRTTSENKAAKARGIDKEFVNPMTDLTKQNAILEKIKDKKSVISDGDSQLEYYDDEEEAYLMTRENFKVTGVNNNFFIFDKILGSAAIADKELEKKNVPGLDLDAIVYIEKQNLLKKVNLTTDITNLKDMELRVKDLVANYLVSADIGTSSNPVAQNDRRYVKITSAIRNRFKQKFLDVPAIITDPNGSTIDSTGSTTIKYIDQFTKGVTDPSSSSVLDTRMGILLLDFRMGGVPPVPFEVSIANIQDIAIQVREKRAAALTLANEEAANKRRLEQLENVSLSTTTSLDENDPSNTTKIPVKKIVKIRNKRNDADDDDDANKGTSSLIGGDILSEEDEIRQAITKFTEEAELANQRTGVFVNNSGGIPSKRIYATHPNLSNMSNKEIMESAAEIILEEVMPYFFDGGINDVKFSQWVEDYMKVIGSKEFNEHMFMKDLMIDKMSLLLFESRRIREYFEQLKSYWYFYFINRFEAVFKLFFAVHEESIGQYHIEKVRPYEWNIKHPYQQLFDKNATYPIEKTLSKYFSTTDQGFKAKLTNITDDYQINTVFMPLVFITEKKQGQPYAQQIIDAASIKEMFISIIYKQYERKYLIPNFVASIGIENIPKVFNLYVSFIEAYYLSYIKTKQAMVDKTLTQITDEKGLRIDKTTAIKAKSRVNILDNWNGELISYDDVESVVVEMKTRDAIKMDALQFIRNELTLSKWDVYLFYKYFREDKVYSLRYALRHLYYRFLHFYIVLIGNGTIMLDKVPTLFRTTLEQKDFIIQSRLTTKTDLRGVFTSGISPPTRLTSKSNDKYQQMIDYYTFDNEEYYDDDDVNSSDEEEEEESLQQQQQCNYCNNKIIIDQQRQRRYQCESCKQRFYCSDKCKNTDLKIHLFYC